MKTSIKLTLAAGLLSVGFANTASALDVYLTGSSAFRAATTNSIVRLLTTPVATYDGTSLAGSTHQIISGTLTTAVTGIAQGTPINVYTCWTGSLSGLSSLAGLNPNQYLTSASLGSESEVDYGTGADSNSGVGTQGNKLAGSPATVTTLGTARNPDGAFSDVYASSTSYNSSSFKEANGTKVLGVVPFLFVGGPDLKNFVPASGVQISNINATQAKQLYAGGLDLAQLTGNPADDNNGNNANLLPVGRNADSGTRFVTFAETGYNPIGGTKQPIQYQVNFTTSGTVKTLTNVIEYPADPTFPGTAVSPTPVGNSGYPSGGNEQAALNVPGTATYAADFNANPPTFNGYMIGTLGESDAANAVKNLGTSAIYNGYFISYNGQGYGTISYATSGGVVGAPITGATVTYLGSAGRTQLEEGVYTLWGYEHEYYLTTSTVAGFLDALGSNVKTLDATIAGDKTANMAVERSVEGGPISYVGVGGSTK